MSTSASSSDSWTSPLRREYARHRPVGVTQVQDAARQSGRGIALPRPRRRSVRAPRVGTCGRSTILSSGRTLWTCRPTPRKVTFAIASPYRSSARSTTVMSSAREHLPCLRHPWLDRVHCAIVSTSLRVKLLLSSASDPPRSTMTRSGRPLSATVCRNPVAIASTETRTATTPAMPITMTLEEPARCGRVCSPIVVKAMSCLNMVFPRERLSASPSERRPRSAASRAARAACRPAAQAAPQGRVPQAATRARSRCPAARCVSPG